VTTTNNVAIGERTRASGGNAIAIGARGTKAEGLAAIALGVGADAKGQNGVAAGQNTVASASGTVAIGGSANAGNGATASSVQAVAIGQLSKASGNKTTALGAEANASGLNSTALGTGASTAGGLGGLNAVAVGAKASANAGSTTAVGAAAQASGVNAAAFGAGAQAGTKGTAVGYNAVVTHNGAIALGADSVSTATFGAVPNATINGITYGNFAAANVNATVSVGSAGNERAITNVGAGRINANSTDAINGSQLYAIGNGLQNQITANKTHYYSVNDGDTRGSNYNNDGARGKNSLAAGINARAGSSNSVAMGDGADTGNGVNSNIKGLNTAIGSNAKIGANGKISWEATAIGADTVAEGVRTTAVGYGASATEYYATALGYKSSAPEWHALAIGSQATVAPTATTDVAAAQAITTNLTNVSDASKSAAAVAIGRQATAAGYGAIAQGLNAQATTAYATTIGANARAERIGSVALGADSAAKAESSIALGRNSVADREKGATGVDPLGAKGTATDASVWQATAGAVSVGNAATKTTRQITNLAAGSEDSDAVNVAQLKAAGFNLAVSQSGGTSTDNTADAADKKINNGKTLTLDAGNGINLQQNGGKITIATNAQAITNSAQLPVVYTKADGSKVYKRGDKFYDAPVGGNEVVAADVIASMQNAAGSSTVPTVLANVASNFADTATATSNPANNARGDFANKGNRAATVNDVLNAGFNVQGNGAAKDFVTHGDTINFANGRGTVANVESQNGVTTVKFDTPLEYVGGTPTAPATNAVKLVGGDASQPVALQNVAAGTNDTDAVNVSQLNAVKTTANKGFKIAGNSKANGITMDNETIKPDETLTVKGTGTGTFATDYNSDNIQTQVSGDGTITIGLKKDIAVNSVTATDGTNTTVTRPTGTVTSDGTGNTTATTANGVKATDTNGNTTSLTQTGITTTDSAGNTTAVNSGGVTISKPGKNVVSLTGDGLNNGGNKITNVAKGEADTDAVNVSQLNAAAKAAKTEVKSADGSVTVTANTPTPGNPTVYDLSVNTDGTTITKDANGKIKANTTALNPGTGNDLGKVIVPPAIPATPTTPAVDYSGRLMTAGDIASAINHSGFVLTTDNTGGGTNTGKSDELINPGKKVTIDAGKNIDIKQEGSKVTVATKDEVAFKQVTIGDAGNNTVLTSTADGLDVGGDKITNVAAGTKDSDAVNVKQLKAAKTEVKAGTNIASVDKTQANDGHDIYTVNAKGTTVSGAGDVIVTATNSGDNVTNYQVSLSGGVKQDIGKGVQAYDIVTTQGIRFGGDTGVTNVHKLGDTMMIMGDQNVKTAADVDGIHMRLNPDVNVNSVTTGDTKMNDEGVAIKNGPALTKQGINAGNLPIRNVAPGRIAPDSRDAVNGAQLHALGRYVDNVDKRAKAGTASAIATAGLPQAYRPGASMVAAAGGYYDGQSAVAIGVSTISDNGRWVIKGAANVNSKEAGATIGIGYQW
ncbi:YadA-like family protein, partial [uncultured Cardiobacterium sp.]|uniref:beta strand repeat-containing protein n=1 Tax=uncultured Cardiobacterium sp. TaxID=417619 RepID=UPI002622A90B